MIVVCIVSALCAYQSWVLMLPFLFILTILSVQCAIDLNRNAIFLLQLEIIKGEIHVQYLMYDELIQRKFLPSDIQIRLQKIPARNKVYFLLKLKLKDTKITMKNSDGWTIQGIKLIYVEVKKLKKGKLDKYDLDFISSIDYIIERRRMIQMDRLKS